jgi:hypothetical protein
MFFIMHSLQAGQANVRQPPRFRQQKYLTLSSWNVTLRAMIFIAAETLKHKPHPGAGGLLSAA